MKLDRLLKTLAAGEITSLKPSDWNALAKQFPVREERETGLAGKLQIVKCGSQIAAVEYPDPKTVVVRPLPSLSAGRDFMRERLAAYDRMWDG